MKKYVLIIMLILSLSISAQKTADEECKIGLEFAEKFDYNNAFAYFYRSAKRGSAEGQFWVGYSYSHGYGVAKNIEKAILWYTRAARQRHAGAYNNLGQLYRYGEEVKQDYQKAFDYFRKAAEIGINVGQLNLGDMYYYGYGIRRDFKKAIYWYTKAAKQNHCLAQFQLGTMYEKGEGVNKNLEQALEWYQKSADQNWDEAQEKVESIKYIIEQEKEKRESIEVDNNIYINPSQDRNIFAIVIGNEKYKNEEDVPFAINDASIFKEYVEKTIGVPYEQIRYVEDASYNDIRLAINWLTQAMTICRGKGRAIIYYAGHGIPNETNKTAYLLPVDGIGNDTNSAFSLDGLYEKLSNVETQSIILFLDACFSGSKREEGMLTSARSVAIKVKPSTPKGNLILFSAAQGDETAYPYKDKQHGLFTYYLLKKLQESKGEVTLGELSEYLADEVGRQSFLKNNKIQTPTVIVSPSIQNSWKNLKLK